MRRIDLQYFDLTQIAESGQCFRMTPLSKTKKAYSVISGGRYLEISQEKTAVSLFCGEEDFPFWERFFDLDGDYETYLSSVAPADSYLQKAAACGSGIRILNQDVWEMIITFVISQQKTIPKIKELAEALCLSYGTKKTVPEAARLSEDSPAFFYTFPAPEQLGRASLDDLRAMKLGYRAKYIKKICEDACFGALDFPRLKAMDYPEALAYLQGFFGIGEKVANCVCLFGLHQIDAFPIDTWIKKILLQEYADPKRIPAGEPPQKFYEALVKEHFSRYRGYAGVMQQYIFYYERLCRGKL